MGILARQQCLLRISIGGSRFDDNRAVVQSGTHTFDHGFLLLALSRGPRHAAHGANEKVQERQVLRAFPCAVQRPSDGFVDDISRLDANPDRISYGRSEEHTSELQSLMRISYAVLCLKKKRTTKTRLTTLS